MDQSKKRALDNADRFEEIKRLKNELSIERKKLPVYSARERIIKEIKENETIILVGETGSGKTTQIPQYIYESGLNIQKDGSRDRGVVLVTQPRRVAAITLAGRVASELGTSLGAKVGYSVRFDDCCSEETVIKYLTDGMLLKEILSDPDLLNCNFVILDEAHERTLRTDILFGLVKEAQKRSQGRLKVIVMSATLDAEKFSNYFNNAKILVVEGRQYSVEKHYVIESQPDYLDAALITCLQLHINQSPGDVLVFLTGQEEIESLEKLLKENAKRLPPESLKMIVYPLYAGLAPAQQMRVFQKTPENSRKIILATNIAETSVTINGIVYVVDSGYVKERNYIPKLGMESLQIRIISKAAANQRAGRAGRERAGICYRLYCEQDFLKFEPNPIPEIKRCNLSSVILMLKALKIDDVFNFNYIDKPPTESIVRALEELYALGALNDQGKISALGNKMVQLPLDPNLAKVLLYSEEHDCLEEILKIVSILSVENVFFSHSSQRELAEKKKKLFASNDGDHITLLNVYEGYLKNMNDKDWCSSNFINQRNIKTVMDVYNQLKRFCDLHNIGKNVKEKEGNIFEKSEKLRLALLAGFFQNTAILQKDGSYKTLVTKKEIKIHPSSVLFGKKHPCIVYHELVLTSKLYARTVSVIDSSWLQIVAPSFFGKVSFKDS